MINKTQACFRFLATCLFHVSSTKTTYGKVRAIGVIEGDHATVAQTMPILHSCYKMLEMKTEDY